MIGPFREHFKHLRRLSAAKLRDPAAIPLVNDVREKGLTYLDPAALYDLRGWARRLDAQEIPGAIVEAGCALGGSAIVLAASKRSERPMFVHDVFGMIPPPTKADGADVHARYEEIKSGQAEGLGGGEYYGYQEHLVEQVASSFKEFAVPIENNNVTLVQGLFEDTIHPSEPVALAHVDGDWYESVRVCLDRIWPMLSPGGAIVLDDYYHWTGCRTAVDEFMATNTGFRVHHQARLQLVKLPG